MASYNDVFERKEVKYRLSAEQARRLQDALAARMAPDAFGTSQVTSLYYDTPERALIERSLDKPVYKEKLRVRWYGDAACGLDTPAFVELKKKFKGIVYKRRLALTLPAALAFVSGLPYEQACARWPLPDAGLAAVALAPATRQIARELEAAMNRWLPLAPSMGIACDRVAWAYRPEVREARGCDELLDAELRITFDDCLAYFDCHRFRSPWRPIIESSESVMEIKSAGPYPPWLVEVLSAERIYPASFTKYGNAYQMATAEPRARNHRRAMRGGA